MLLCNCDKKPIHFALVVKQKKKEYIKEEKRTKLSKNFVNLFSLSLSLSSFELKRLRETRSGVKKKKFETRESWMERSSI